MGLILKVDEFEEAISDIGCLKTEPVRVVLDRLKAAGVVVPITGPTSSCAPVLKKSGKVRICLDLKKLNRAI